MSDEKRQFWGLVELMGYQKLAGLITEEELGGAKMLRVDVPGVEAEPPTCWGAEQPSIAPWTRYVGGSALYAVTPMTEEACRLLVRSLRVDPVYVIGINHIVREVEAPKQLANAAAEAGPDDDVLF